MTSGELFSFYQRMNDQKIWIAYKGALSQDILVELGTIIKDKIGFDNNIKRVFAIFVEMAQNVLHYSAEKETSIDGGVSIGVGLIVVTGMVDSYLVSSGNLVENSYVDKLIRHCEYIRSLDGKQLKQLYLERRSAPLPEGSKGAGLGLIDIARKADQPLQYAANNVSEQYSFFTFTAVVRKGGKTEQ